MFLAKASRFSSASIVFSTILPQREAAASQYVPLPGACPITRWFTLRPTLFVWAVIFPCQQFLISSADQLPAGFRCCGDAETSAPRFQRSIG